MITIDRRAPEALHRQIYDAFRTAIVDGGLRSGQRVPSTRVLASELGVSRFPVLNAYAQLLAEGYLESRVGSGTVVSSSLPDQAMPADAAGARFAVVPSGPRPVAQRAPTLPLRSPWFQGFGAFRVGQVAFDHFPHSVWLNLTTRRCRMMDDRAAIYGDQLGSKALRETIAMYLRTARSLRCEADQIMIVSGSQQALSVTARVLFDPGNRVWMEEPGYSLAREVFLQAGCHVIPVPVDEDGLDVATGIARCRKARAAFVTPSHQFPLGATMSASRRLQLLDWSASAGSWIIEDDYDSEYRYESLPIASLQGLDVNSRVLYVGTFSKVVFPSLRLGYVVIPPDLVDRFIATRRSNDLGPATFLQEVLADFIGGGHFARHIRRMRVLYRERRSVLVECIQKELGSVVEVLGDEAGMHVVVTLPKWSHDVEIARRAATQGLMIWPLSFSYMGTPSRQGFILGFGGTSTTEIPPAVRRLRKLITGK